MQWVFISFSGDISIWKSQDKINEMCEYHYIDVIMTKMASQITSLTVVYSTVYSDADQRKHQSFASLAFVWGIHRDRWIPRTKGQLRGKCFHLMTSSCQELGVTKVHCWPRVRNIFHLGHKLRSFVWLIYFQVFCENVKCFCFCGTGNFPGLIQLCEILHRN